MKTDAELQRAVQRELRWDPRVAAMAIGVTVEQAVVTLTGTVSGASTRLTAEELARRVDGVRDVANELEVTSSSGLAPSDTEVARAVRRMLEWDALIPDRRVQSTVRQGWVTLTGQVETEAERQEAGRLISTVLGVTGVTNALVVAALPVAPGDVRGRIAAVLERRAERATNHLDLDLRDGTVTLTGPVHSLPERRAILAAVRRTPGVRRVVDHLYFDLNT